MPWKSRDAKRHTKKATTPKQKRQWKAVANNVYKSGGNEGKAIRMANAAVKKSGRKR